jgi:8-oxo-dGTP diphosphatase
MKNIEVVCGIIWKEGQVLIARRKSEKTLGGFWEFPGGKIEEGENPESALKRELKEELGMNVLIRRHFGTNIHEYENLKIQLMAYACDFVSATFQLTDHDEWRFVKPNEFRNYCFAPADISFLNKIQLEFQLK